MTAEDRELLLGIYMSTRADELAATGWPDEAKRAFLMQQFAAQDLHYRRHYPEASYDVVLIGGEPAGRLYVDRGPDEILLVEIALLPAFRGNGVGSAILGALAAEADAAGRPLAVHVEHTNRARGLYERHGFETATDEGVYLLLRRQPIMAS